VQERRQGCFSGAAALRRSSALCQAKAVAPQPMAVLEGGPGTQDIGKRGLQLPRCQPSLFGEMSWLAVRLLLELVWGWNPHIRAEGIAGHIEHRRILNHWCFVGLECQYCLTLPLNEHAPAVFHTSLRLFSTVLHVFMGRRGETQHLRVWHTAGPVVASAGSLIDLIRSKGKESQQNHLFLAAWL